ncbi:acetyl-CoA carboxylase biotin carboxyl carrier protein [Ornithobacterium rhinotracheale]|uniref:acetyl-CoA carboxylase biotin carboxyl carrier protein n=1 Tax=Ornithobacterium rhinotracheale TaxID=28251 RepID=UPI00129CE807|nr:acetyl-CoA carboxylase biotin carboxyl carrier protein [Ornithobacterium rhinotracheale]MCK0202255.1 acetyl-CoA carboxylase biotin carboxyl carrier protein [Ornithobacterium rhinotracheale]MRI63164.1 acetyl-CoA carboxylase biotin carboxyl carrier protein [Ornithobacterium rhinotracheale]MRJ10878.1 acetyl-CoA carboxylase biotin carboxyl carrier protein [Ornithobacterium rhinotracheale]
MDKKEIRELITFVSESGVSEVKLKTDKFEIEIKNPQQAPVQYQVASPAPAPVATPAPAPQAAAPQAAAPAPASEEADNYLTIKSPMIGTFYRKPSPDKDVFVNVGDTVKAGDVVCVIEAMKLFNEIESEIQGKIVKVLAEDSTPVEYDQPLFLVDPNA